ncbi:MAG: response regulator [Cytophagaceae bacterium]|nr:response regulator [Cytophagaceae bacterium]
MIKFQSVMIIDDDPVSNYMTRYFFKRTNICDNFIFCRHGKDGIHYLKTRAVKPELILVGTHLPVMNGFEFLERVNEAGLNTDATKIFLYTLHSSEVLEQREKYNVNLLEKPLTYEKFFKAFNTSAPDTSEE